ncbi:MAG: ATP-binding protein [Clostridia bacterium]|nr:ATP-binding protein [Clostridia bacterium]
MTSKKTYKSPLPGTGDYIDAVTNNYYVDKTLLIKTLIDEHPTVALFTRPRRFGKSLNMSMIQTFFEKTDDDKSVYFKGKKIWKCGKKYRDEQGKYPVICISFHTIEDNTWDDSLGNIKIQISEEFKRHSELAEPGALKDDDLEIYNNIKNFKADISFYKAALMYLTRFLSEYYSQPVIVIIDEYDTPIRNGQAKGFYNDAISFMNIFYSMGLKGNKFLKQGILTGVLSIAQASTYTGLNHLYVSTITRGGDEYFGFTKDEVRDLLAYYGYEDKFEELYEWYDGYLFGSNEIYNPWSVMYYVYYKCTPDIYWVDTADNSDLKLLLRASSNEMLDGLIKLKQGGTVESNIEEHITYSDIYSSKENIYTLLLSTGYLKATKINSDPANKMYKLKLPNKEVSVIFDREIVSVCEISEGDFNRLWDSLLNRDAETCEQYIQRLMQTEASSLDTAYEYFYHGFMFCLCAYRTSNYIIRTNRDSGVGRYDITAASRKGSKGIVFELKSMNNRESDYALAKASEQEISDALYKEAQKAVEQIDRMHYVSDLIDTGHTDILKVGIAFKGQYLRMCIV